ncbi:MAG: YciI family protein [Candidatus Cloacimonetes bacterium]|nr:YciI family protein [Candidatus Cloacimonadota bacterium]
MKEYIYTLKLIPKYWDKNNWTDKEDQIISQHFNKLIHLKATGSLILAGKTEAEDETAFGIVIFKSKNDQEAYVIMESDPAVRSGIMTATLREFNVALISADNRKK